MGLYDPAQSTRGRDFIINVARDLHVKDLPLRLLENKIPIFLFFLNSFSVI